MQFRAAAKKYLESLDGPVKKQLYADVGRRPIRYFGQMLIKNIGRGRVSVYRKARVAGGGKASTINREIYFVKRVLRMVGVTLELKLLKGEVRHCVALTADDLKSVLASSATRESWRAPAAWAAIAAGTGIWDRKRLQELTWGDVDPFNDTLKIEGWEYPMTDEMRESLISLELRREIGRPLDRIFTTKEDHHRWGELIRAAGLPPVKKSDFAALAPLMIMIELKLQADEPETRRTTPLAA